MSDVLKAVQADFEELAKRLTALLEAYEDEGQPVVVVERLRAARDNAARGAELARELR